MKSDDYFRHKLKPTDFPRRIAMCQDILTKSNVDPTWLPNLWTSDEANFNLNGFGVIFKNEM